MLDVGTHPSDYRVLYIVYHHFYTQQNIIYSSNRSHHIVMMGINQYTIDILNAAIYMGWTKSDKSKVTKTVGNRAADRHLWRSTKSCIPIHIIVNILQYIIIHVHGLLSGLYYYTLYHNIISLSYTVCITRIPTRFEIDNICLPSRNYIFITHADTRPIILCTADCVQLTVTRLGRRYNI